MATIQNLNGDSLSSGKDKINANFTGLNAEVLENKANLVTHKTSTDHPAEKITYTGDVQATNVKDAIDKTDQRINNIITSSGTSSTEVVDARGTHAILKDRLDKVDSSLADKTTNLFSKKKIVCFGDSITDFGMYTSLLPNLLNATVYNVGFAGCTLINNGSKFSMGEIVDAVTSGVYTAQDATGLYSSHLATLKAIDFNTIDVVTIAYSTNDFHLGYALGNDTDTTPTTIKGTINYVTKKLLQAYPNLEIVFLTPTYRDMFDTIGDGINSDDYPNTKGVYLKEYVEAIQVACALNHVQCIDLYHNSGINRYTASIYLVDGLHPTVLGGQVMAETIVRGLTSSPYNTEMYFNKKDADKRYQFLKFGNLVTDCEFFENHLDENSIIDISGVKYLTNKSVTVASYMVLARSKGIGLRPNTAILLTCKLKTNYTGNVRFDLNHYYVIPATISADVSATKVTVPVTADVEQDIRLVIRANATTDLTRVIETTLNVLNLSTGSVYIRNAVITKVDDYATTDYIASGTMATGWINDGTNPLKYKLNSPTNAHLKGKISCTFDTATMNGALYPIVTGLAFKSTADVNLIAYAKVSSQVNLIPVLLMLRTNNTICIVLPNTFINGDTVVIYFDNTIIVSEM